MMNYTGKRSPITHRFGVLPVSIYSAPSPCGGRCTYCPTDGKFPKSYTENEDTRLAKGAGYSAYLQLEKKLSKFDCINTPLEIIILGGSFSAGNRSYRQDFINSIDDYLLKNSPNKQVPDKNSLVGNRCSVLTVESRPDQIDQAECDFLRELGVSKVEIGVQHTLDSVLESVRREHTQEEVIRATELLKMNGFKVGYHVMIGLPSAHLSDDIEMLSNTLWKPEYSPDYLKVYPCVLLKNAEKTQPILFRSWQSGAWKSPDEEYCLSCLDALADGIPDFVRVARIQRQFENTEVADGIPMGIRRKVTKKLLDVRAREFGSKKTTEAPDFAKVFKSVWRRENDIIIQMVDSNDTLYAIARLHIDKKNSGIIREIKVFGAATEVGTSGTVQGNGLGTSLLEIVENTLKSNGVTLIHANAAKGARSFFQQNGYHLSNNYFMEKLV